MCTDNNGNVYSLSVVGNNPIIADTFYRPSAYGSPQNFLFTSHNCNGQMRFAKLVSSNQSIPYGVECDEAGHVYIAFYAFHATTSTSYLRIGYDTTITGVIYNRMALVQYDTVGHLNWVRFAGENNFATATAMGGTHNFLSLDGFGNAHYICSAGFGANLTSTLTSNTGVYDFRYDVSGNLLSVDRLQIDSTLFVNGVAIDKFSHKIYAYGYRNNFSFPDSSIHSYLTALDVSRNRIWIDTFANPYFTGGTGVGGIAVDGLGHLYLTPNAPRCFVFRGDTSINTIASGASKISGIMKLDTSGNVIWSNFSSGSTGTNSLFGITLLPNNKIAATGVMTSRVVNGIDTMDIYSGEGQNTLIFVVDSSGFTQTFNQIHGIGFYDRGNICTGDNVGNLYIGGKVENNIWAGTLSPYTSVGGDSDYFIMKYGVNCSCTAMPISNYSYSGTTDLTRSFTYTGTTTGIDSVKWTFGDGTTSSSMSPIHTYTGSGTYTTCVRVYSSCGNDMRCKEVTVSCAATPIASFRDDDSLVHSFTYTGTIAGYDSVVWDFGDGTTDTGFSPIHTYAVADTYYVCATVYTNCGSHTWCKDIFIGVPGSVSSVSISFANVQVYPNPSKEELYITGIPQEADYRILNVVGVILQHGSLQKGHNTIGIQNLPSGILMLEISGKDGSKNVIRIVKQ